MKLNIDIDVDLGLSTVTKKRLIRYGIPLAVILGGGALAWAGNPWALPQPSFPQNGPLTASDLNNNFNALADAGAALQAQVATLGVPSGTVVAFPGPAANIPSGWVLCDGTAYNGALPAYAALYAAIGVSNGGNVGAMEFNVPDYRGYFLRGLDTTAGAARDPDVGTRSALNAGGNTGPEVGSLEADAFAAHTHGVHAQGGVAGTYYAVTTLSDSANEIYTDPAGGTETRPKNVSVNYIIKL